MRAASMGIMLPNSSRVSLLTYKAIAAVRYPELVLHDQDPIQIGHFVPHDYTVGQEDSVRCYGKYLNTPETSWLLLRILWSFSTTYKSVIETSIKVRRRSSSSCVIAQQCTHNCCSMASSCLVWRSADCHHLVSSRSHGTNSSGPDRMWVPQWGTARCNGRRQRGLLWTSHCRAHSSHPAYVHCLPH